MSSWAVETDARELSKHGSCVTKLSKFSKTFDLFLNVHDTLHTFHALMSEFGHGQWYLNVSPDLNILGLPIIQPTTRHLFEKHLSYIRHHGVGCIKSCLTPSSCELQKFSSLPVLPVTRSSWWHGYATFFVDLATARSLITRNPVSAEDSSFQWSETSEQVSERRRRLRVLFVARRNRQDLALYFVSCRDTVQRGAAPVWWNSSSPLSWLSWFIKLKFLPL